MILPSQETLAVARPIVSPLPVALAAGVGPPPVAIPEDEQALYLDLARIAVAVATGARPASALTAALEVASLPDRPAAAFVTLTEDGDLRGCMGNLDADSPAWESVVDAAGWAARRDPRFPSVRPGELERIEIDVSILGPMVRLDDPRAFRPGIDGIVARGDGRRGLLLPEVAESVGHGPTQMLDACCRKAGLWAGAWREPGTELWVFRTHRFGGPAA
jgi:AmmeMemoRadiSam system protein A